MFGKGRGKATTCTKAYVDLPPLPQMPPLKTFAVTLPDGGTTRVKGHWYGDDRYGGDNGVRIYRRAAPTCLAVTVDTDGGINVEWSPALAEIVATFAKWIAIEEWPEDLREREMPR